MAIAAKKYIRKPLHVEAVRVTAANFLEITFWCKGSIQNIDGSSVEDNSIEPKSQLIKVEVSHARTERQAQAKIGDWILKNEKGFKVYTDKAFQNSFDPVPEEGDPEVSDAPEPSPAAPTPAEEPAPAPEEPTEAPPVPAAEPTQAAA